jgi:hypothetical protein
MFTVLKDQHSQQKASNARLMAYGTLLNDIKITLTMLFVASSYLI